MNSDAPLYVDVADGKSSDTKVFRITGPITLRNLFGLQGELRKGGVPKISVLDLSAVPYMDSAGMGAVINYYTHCGNKGGRMIVAGVSKRVLELFKLTKVDTIIPIVASVADAELDS
jgi:anti-anti-sigma factor